MRGFRHGELLMQLAAHLGYSVCVSELLQHDAHVMAFSRTGTHAFFSAMRVEHLVIARTLLHVNPNEALNTTDGRGISSSATPSSPMTSVFSRSSTCGAASTT